MKLKLSIKTVGTLCIAVLLVEFLYLFGFVGIRSFLSLVLFFFIPIYVILSFTSLGTYEKLFLSFLLGLGLFPLTTFYFNRIIPSLRITLVIIILIILVIGFFKFKNIFKRS